jgi:hypothetical protein
MPRDSAGECDEATPGYYVNMTGATSMTPCASGSAVSQSKATSCELCFVSLSAYFYPLLCCISTFMIGVVMIK